jgi:IstB-like ATP binding protein
MEVGDEHSDRTRQHHSDFDQELGDWGSIFGDSIIATAILDRLLHHSTTINIRGKSYRLRKLRVAYSKPAISQARNQGQELKNAVP